VRLLRFLFQAHRRRILVVTGIGVISGLAASGFIAILNSALHAPDKLTLLLPFVVLVLARILSNVYAQFVVMRFTQDAVLDLSESLSRQVIETPFRTLERIGPSRIMATLTDDVLILASALISIPTAVTNGAVLLGCGVYLAILSWRTAAALVVFALVGALGYHLLLRRAYDALLRARLERDTLFRHFRELTDGIKELQMSRTRRGHAIGDIVASSARSRELNLAARRLQLVGDGWAQLMFFALIGLMIFVMPGLEKVSAESITAYAVVALYIMSPLWALIGALPALQRGQAAYDRIQDLGLSLAGAAPDSSVGSVRAPAQAALEFRGVSFNYGESDSEPHAFALGPIDLTVESGELLFVIGGNGSGKSTFVKLLTGLYIPDAGEILLNGRAIDASNRGAYREQFAAVFSDFFLFDRLVAPEAAQIDDEARRYLGMLDLLGKVAVERGVLSTTALSQGQRRRLALLSAYLEERPFYVFDEWAADQDPAYRQIFYATLLPELKARGKSVVVVTHDDRYFHLGDRVVKLEYGRVAEIWRPGDGDAPGAVTRAAATAT
jgi:putative pyoverdin transport system ATP-binding/permease protein